MELFTVEQLSETTNESVAVWRKRILHKEIPYVKCGGNVRVKEEDLKRWVDERRVEAVANQ